jgi:hypothetical protein
MGEIGMTTIRSLFEKEVYIRLSGGAEFTCTTRFAGFRISTRRVALSKASQIDDRETGAVLRRREYRIEARRQDEE